MRTISYRATLDELPPGVLVVAMPTCRQCLGRFECLERELKLREQISPVIDGRRLTFHPSTLCPACREQRRLSFRNERKLYHNTSACSGKNLISIFSPDKPYSVYHHDEWWGDGWDACSYGREYDASRSFFEQFAELWRAVPQIALFSSRNENSDYTNFSEQERNCYLTFASNRNEDCLYSEYIWDSKDCIDCTNIQKSERLYSCVDCSSCYECLYVEDCHSCSDLAYCFDCQGCNNLFACAGLRQHSFCILNEQLTESAYRQKLADRAFMQGAAARFESLKSSTPRLFAKLVQCEHVTGSNLKQCKNVFCGFNAFDCEDGIYVENAPGKTKDVLDVSGATSTELGLELVSVAYGYRTAFTLSSHTGIRDSYYTVCCHSGSNLFGCVGLRNKEFCILNRQYSESEYQALLLHIASRMMQQEEWGEFFPASISPWCYNETVAADFYPLPRSEVEGSGLRWFDDGLRASDERRPAALAGDLSDAEVLGQVFSCARSNRPYRVIAKELKFLRQHSLALPSLCPDERYRNRLRLQPGRKLREARCDCRDDALFGAAGGRCPHTFLTPYGERPDCRIYCEACYLRDRYG